MVTATARVLSMTVATRNVKHFTGFYAPVCNPFAYKDSL
jgi:predicted nucleic acid-binding protein